MYCVYELIPGETDVRNVVLRTLSKRLTPVILMMQYALVAKELMSWFI